ncbi:MAG: hypothetical protein QM813_01855 [Verrucomicrobiota bacterium]
MTDSGVVNWRGVTGAASYDLQRTDQAAGPWRTVIWRATADGTQYQPLAVDEFTQVGRTYFYRLIAHNEAGASQPSQVLGPVTIRCRTVVDEFKNTFQIYRKDGKMELRSNDARNYKEDCHRLWGAPGAWIAYQVTGKIRTVRVYAFDEKGAAGLNFYAGVGGTNGLKLPSQSETFFAGKELYNYRAPRFYTVARVPDEASGLSIAFEQETQLKPGGD